MFLTSSFAHLLNCISFRARHICFSCDYSAIFYYTMAAGMIHAACTIPDVIWETLLIGPTTYIITCVIACCVTLWMICQTRLPKAKVIFYLDRAICAID
jgi:hypothetical protein